VDQQSLEPVMELAERVEPVDLTTWDVTVRADARFADGAPVTSRDVLYTFHAILDPSQHTAVFRAFDERIASIEALDDRRVRFHLKQPLATFVSDLDFGIMDARQPPGPVSGAGPFRIESQDRGEVVLARNEHYFRGAPPLRRLVFRTIEETSARMLALVGGSLDLCQNSVRADLIGALLDKPRLRVEKGPSTILTYMLLKNDDPILGNVKVRQAIAHAIDRRRLIDAKFDGAAVMATGLVAPSHWAYEGDVERYDYDPALARRLLDEAGYPDPDGDGPAPRFTLSYKTSSDQFRVGIARVIAAQLADVGIAVDVRPFEWATFFADLKAGAYQIATMQSGEIVEPDMYYVHFHSSRIPTPQQPELQNRWRYRNAEIDHLLEAGRTTLDRGERKRIYSEVQKILARDLPIIPLWHEDNLLVRNRDVADYELLPNARFSPFARVRKAR
jgi:peptide/nickel transport system substrate-binding protein